MNKQINMQAHRGNTPLLNAVALVLFALVIFCMVSCKKSVAETEATKKQNLFARVVDVDNDGKEYPSTIVGDKIAVKVNGGRTYTGSEPLGFSSDHERRNWCNYLTFFYDYFPGYFCKWCPETVVCSATPVNYVSINLSGNTLTWVTANESNISHFRVEISTDGKTFLEAGKVSPKGDGLYSFTIK